MPVRHINRTPTTSLRRRALLTAALGFRAIEWRYRPDPARALEKYLDSWRGLGDVIVGMHAQGFDVELRQLRENSRANFYATGIAHSVVWLGLGADAVARGQPRGVAGDLPSPDGSVSGAVPTQSPDPPAAAATAGS